MICLEDSSFTNLNFVVSVDPNCISKSGHFNFLVICFIDQKHVIYILICIEVALELLQKLMHIDVLDVHL